MNDTQDIPELQSMVKQAKTLEGKINTTHEKIEVIQNQLNELEESPPKDVLE